MYARLTYNSHKRIPASSQAASLEMDVQFSLDDSHDICDVFSIFVIFVTRALRTLSNLFKRGMGREKKSYKTDDISSQTTKKKFFRHTIVCLLLWVLVFTVISNLDLCYCPRLSYMAPNYIDHHAEICLCLNKSVPMSPRIPMA